MKKILKNSFAVLMSIAMILFEIIPGIQGYASSYDVVFEYDNVSVVPGQEFDYAFKVTENNRGFDSITIANLVTTFGSKGFVIKAIKKGNLVSGSINTSPTMDKVIINEKVSGTGVLFYITLVAPESLGTKEIEPQIADLSDGSYYLDYDYFNGSINITNNGGTTQYSINYNANGGTGAPDSQSKSKGVAVSLSSTKPTKNGYDFKGWDTSSAGKTVVYKAGDTYTKDEDVTLYAVWSPTTYKISFNANGGTGAPDSQTKTYGTNLTLSTTKPTRDGYTFAGWADTASATSAKYSAGGTFTDNKNCTLYAVWTKTYTVSYNANGGSGAPASQVKIHDVALPLSTTKPTRTGYTFQGWATSASSSTVAYAAGASYTKNEAITLYAIWKADTYTIKYNMNGGSATISDQTKTYGKDLTLSTTKPTKTGYDFLGWSTSSSATTATYTAGGTYKDDKAVTLYAVWKTSTYTIKYNMNGGSGTISDQTKTYGKDLTLSTTKPTKTGYDFLGWSTSSSATKATYTAGGTYTENKSVTLYAVWKAKTYTIKYNMNGGSGTISNQTKTYGKALTLSTTKPTRTGYVFLGWSTSSSATTAKYTAGGTYTDNKAVTLYAVWKASDIKITTQPTSQTLELGSTASFKVVATGSGLSYQWQYSYDKENWKNSSLASAKTANYTFKASINDKNMYVRCIVSDTIESITSNVALLTISGLPTITQQPQSLHVDLNGKAEFKVVAEGKNIVYQWQYSYDKEEWKDSKLASAITDTYAFTASQYDNNMYVRCLVSNEYDKVFSDVVLLSVGDAPSISMQPISLSVEKGSVATFEVKAIGKELTYQWQYSYDKKTWRDSSLSSAKTSQYTFTASSYDNNMYARCIIKNASGTVTSAVVKIAVYEKPAITSQPKSLVTSKGSLVSFGVKATGTDLTYQWQYSYDKEEWKDSKIASAITDTYAFTASQYDNNMYVRCLVANEYGKVISDVAFLTVGDAPAISMQPLSLSVGKGSVATFEVKASGTGITYQWQYSYDKISWNNSSISSAKTSQYTFTASSYDNNMYARCLVSNIYGTTISDVVKITVYEAPSITSQPKSLSVAKGTVATFEVKASGTGITYQWQYSYDKSTWKNSSISSAKTNQYTFTASSYDNNMYARCVVSNSYGTVISDVVKIAVGDAPYITSQPKSLTVNKGSVAVFEVVATGSGLSYQWQYSYDNNTWKDSSLNAAKTSKYAFTASSYDNNMYARCVVKNSYGTVVSTVVKIEVK